MYDIDAYGLRCELGPFLASYNTYKSYGNLSYFPYK